MGRRKFIGTVGAGLGAVFVPRWPARGGTTRSASSPCAPSPVVTISRKRTNRSYSGPSQASVVSSLTPVQRWVSGELAICEHLS